MRACVLQAPELEEGSWRVKHHSQPDPEAPASSAEEQPALTSPVQAVAAPVDTPPDVAIKQQPDVVPAAQTAAAAEQQPDVAHKQQPDVDPGNENAPAEQRQPKLLPETQGVTSGQMFAALANVGNLADIYPDSQAEPARQLPAHEPPAVPPEEAAAPQDKSPDPPQVG